MDLNEKLDSHLQLQRFVFSLKSKLSDRYMTKSLPKSNKLLFENWKLDPTFKQDRRTFYSVDDTTIFYSHTFSFNSEKSFNETSYKWVKILVTMHIILPNVKENFKKMTYIMLIQCIICVSIF